MKEIAIELERLMDNYKPQLLAVPESALVNKPSPTKWSKKEIIGHLIDSAQSNIRRFVVAQYEETPFIVYNQDKWVTIVNYQEWKSKELIDLWYLVNREICMILSNTSAIASQRTCQTQELHTIEWLAVDYLKHLKHHMHVVLDLESVAYP